MSNNQHNKKIEKDVLMIGFSPTTNKFGENSTLISFNL